jgi:hypothetical protein
MWLAGLQGLALAGQQLQPWRQSLPVFYMDSGFLLKYADTQQ